MPLYMSQFGYTPEAWKAFASNPEDRSEAVGRLAESMGARLVSMYFSFGEYDGLTIMEAPDDKTAAATLLAAVSAGHIKTIKTTTLLTTGDMVEVLGRTSGVSYRGPGQ